jgi:hypothetical protein
MTGWQLFWVGLVIVAASIIGCYGYERWYNWRRDRQYQALTVFWDDPPHWIVWKSPLLDEQTHCSNCKTEFQEGDRVFVFPQEEEDLLYCEECVSNEG